MGKGAGLPSFNNEREAGRPCTSAGSQGLRSPPASLSACPPSLLRLENLPVLEGRDSLPGGKAGEKRGRDKCFPGCADYSAHEQETPALSGRARQRLLLSLAKRLLFFPQTPLGWLLLQRVK